MLTHLVALVATTTAFHSANQPDPSEFIFLNPVEVRIFDRTNAERIRYGQKALEFDDSLMKSARRHCQWMCRNGNMTHTSDPVAENIAAGQMDAKGAMSAWMNSSGHRANILSGGYTKIGVAAYQMREGGTIYWCQQFK